MATKRHAFGAQLMLDDAIEDAVHTDMFFVDQVMNLEPEKQIQILTETFNLTENSCRYIVDEGFYIALFEASTNVNNGVSEIASVKTLRTLCAGKNGHLGTALIEESIERFRLFVQLFALDIKPQPHKEFFSELNISRRNAYSIKDVLANQIAKEKSKMAWLREKEKTKEVRSFLQESSLEFALTNLKSQKNSKRFTATKLMINLSNMTQIPINLASREIIDLVLKTASDYQQGIA